MSYRVDIPTLSANEVYTLTFEYGGTETIQLVVGDLTLETTDRRVVFTTTSPVNYIESNVILTNLNMYEGYYEGDDFGGEYTQESYIEGRSLVNLYDPNIHYKQNNTNGLSFSNSSYFQKTITEDGFINCKILNADAINSSSSAWQQLRTYSTMSQGNTDVFTVILFLRKNNVKTTGLTVKFGYGHTSYEVTEIVKGDIDPSSGSIDIPTGQTGIYHAVIKRGGYSSRVSLDYYANSMEIGFSGDWKNGELEYSWVVLEGDHHDEFVNGEINYFTGIGCVKSPTIISHEDSSNLFYIKDYTCTVNGGTVYSRNGKISFSGYFNGYTNIDIIKGGVWDDKPNCYYEPGTYYLKAHYKTIKPRPNNNNSYTANFVFVCADGTTNELIGMPIVAMGGTFNTVQQYTLTATSPIVKIYYKIWYGGTRDWVTIENVSISKVDREYIQGEEDNVILETSVVSTPNDLELYKVNDTTYDKLDLTTGILYKNTGTYVLDETFVDRTSKWDTSVNDTTGNVIFTSRQHKYLRDEYNFPYSLYNNAIVSNADPASNIVNNSNIKITRPRLYFDIYSNNNYTVIIMPASYNVTTLEELRIWLQNNPMIFNYKLGTPYTEQISLNPLKSYRNGSITTSSQQLTPTLKTTLPISNKFTTTNLSSGQTYNIYFDGTATKLDAGGTIITNPVSPCEVECGGTTLTIEGTDIQNVRVIETSVKNEVGNNSTSDVELTKIVTYEHNNIASNVRYSKNSYEYQCSLKLDNTNHSFTISGAHSSSRGSVNTGINYPSGISLVHIACDITMPSENLMANIYFGNGVWNSYQNFQNVTLNNDTATIKQTTQRFGIGNSYKDFFSTLVTGGHYSNLMYVVSKNNAQTDESLIITVSTMLGQTLEGYTGVGGNGVTISNLRVKVMENYPNITTLDNVTSVLRENNGSTIIWEDMDLTFIQNISDLEQPIKLRSLGTTYDSYNPVTGELTKRIGVSETDGSYSVLSSPIVNQVEIDNIPHLYTNGQVKVYSESDVYPTIILNGQSTNNYEVNELNKSNNYTIRYDGTCESINLNGKSNEQGTNRIVKTSTNGSGNLTFVNDNGDIDNVLLVQNDVREQEINHFNGLQTVEVSKMIVQSPISKHLFYNHGLNDFVPRVNTNYSFDENNNLILSNGYGNNVDTMLQTVDKYTLEKGDSVIFRVVGVENFAADHRLYVKLATQNFAFGGYSPDSYVNFKAPKVQEIINEQGYCDVVYTYNSETITDNIQISNLFGKWIISSVVLCKQSQEIITPIIIDLPQPVQLNGLPDGTCDTYNPITGEYVQRVNGKPYTGEENWMRGYHQLNCMSYSLELDKNNPKFSTSSYCTDLKQFNTSAIDDEGYFLIMGAYYTPMLTIRLKPETLSGISFEEWLVQSGIVIFHAIKPITTQLTPINIPTFEGGTLQLITTDGKVFPMIEYSMPTNNRYDTSSWETGAVYTQRNMTEVYFNDSTTPMTPTETTTLTTDHISSGSIILNDNGNGLIVLKGNYTGRDIPYFTGMRSVEAIEVETTPSPEQPIFGKGGRK